MHHHTLQFIPELPRLHHVKALRKGINLTVDPVRLPEPYNGYYLHIKEAVTDALTSLVSQQ